MTWRYLVTGAQGFVGRFVVADLLRSDPTALILGTGRSPASTNSFTHKVTWAANRMQAPLPEELPASLFADARYDYLNMNVQDAERIAAVLDDFQPNRVIHMASGLWGDSPEKLFRCNVEGTVNLLRAIGILGLDIDSIVLGSSGGVYGEITELPIDETMTPLPLHMYSVSKLAGEMAAHVVAREFDLSIRVARIFNIVGPGQDERHVCGRWLAELSAIAAGLKPTGFRVGALSTTRDMIDVRDTASAIRVLCELGHSGEAYNVASGQETKMQDILNECLRITELENAVEILQALDRKVDLPRHFGSIEKLSRLGWKPQFTLNQSLRDLHRYYVKKVAPLSLEVEAGDIHAQ